MRNDHSEHKVTHISVRFPQDVDLDSLRQIAKRNKRSLNSEIVLAVQDHIERERTRQAYTASVHGKHPCGPVRTRDL